MLEVFEALNLDLRKAFREKNYVMKATTGSTKHLSNWKNLNLSYLAT